MNDTPMTDNAALGIDVKTKSKRDGEMDGKVLGAVVLGLGGAATVGWMVFLAWGMLSLISLAIG